MRMMLHNALGWGERCRGGARKCPQSAAARATLRRRCEPGLPGRRRSLGGSAYFFISPSRWRRCSEYHRITGTQTCGGRAAGGGSRRDGAQSVRRRREGVGWPPAANEWPGAAKQQLQQTHRFDSRAVPSLIATPTLDPPRRPTELPTKVFSALLSVSATMRSNCSR